MKKVSLLLLLAVISILFSTYPLNAFAQVEDYLDETLKLSQKEGSNEKLKEYFSGIDARSDTLYAYLYIPGRSPRLEGYVYSFDRLLKHASPGAETVIISVEQDADAARLYNERQGYKADHYIYDEEQRYLDFISINSIGLRGTYVLKVALTPAGLFAGERFLVRTKNISMLLSGLRSRSLTALMPQQPALQRSGCRMTRRGQVWPIAACQWKRLPM